MLTTKSPVPHSVFSKDDAWSERSHEGKRRFHWEDALWVLIVGVLTSLWVVLLMSPAWR